MRSSSSGTSTGSISQTRPWTGIACDVRWSDSSISQPKQSSCSSTGNQRGTWLHDRIDEAVLDGFLGRHEAIAVDVAQDLVDVLPGVTRDDLGHALRHVEDLTRGDLDVRGRASEPAGALVDHDLRVREGVALPRRAAAEDHRAGAHPHAETDRRDVRLHIL